MSGMASTATGSLGNQSDSILNGAVTEPQTINMPNISHATSLFSRKNLIILFNIFELFLINTMFPTLLLEGNYKKIKSDTEHLMQDRNIRY